MKLWNTVRSTWRDLDQPIFVGDRLQNNLKAITWVSIVSALMGLVTGTINIIEGQGLVIITGVAFFVGGIVSAISAGVFHNRKVSVLTATLLSFVVFTYYAVFGPVQGFAILWAMAMPIGISYFMSVKYGIIMTVYFEVLIIVLFYTPLREIMAQHYTEVFMQRLPFVFFCVGSFTCIAMISYHRSARFEIEYADRLNEEVNRQTKMATDRANRLLTLSEEMVRTLAITIDAKDKYTNGHSFRVSRYAAALAQHLGWEEREVRHLTREALLHDIGKIGVPDAVLNKPGRLSQEEFSTIKSHAAIGGEILSQSTMLLEAAEVARSHHERYDGTGYPDGLAGEKIPYHARLVSIADAYDAMRSDRIYRKGLAPAIIRGELVRGRGSQFDPVLLDAFLEMVDSGELDRIAQEVSEWERTQADLRRIIEAACA